MLKMYTKSHDLELLQKVDNNGGIFTADERAVVSKYHNKNIHKDYNSIARHFFNQRSSKLKYIDLIRQLVGNKTVNLLSLGAADCILEHYLEYALPHGSKVTATDFDKYNIKIANKYFKNITCKNFDFFYDSISSFANKFDVAVFIASAYVMNNEQYIKLLNDLKNNGVNKIIDICGGVMSFKEKWQYCSPLAFLKRNKLCRKILNKSDIDSLYEGKFHGYMRSKKELRDIYRKTEPKSIKEMSFMSHKHIVVLEY